MKLLTSAVLVSLLGVSAMTGCGAEERRASDFDSKSETDSTKPKKKEKTSTIGGANTAPDANQECASSSTPVERIPTLVYFVVDDSGSMSSNEKWEATADSLKAIFEDMGKTNDKALNVGLLFFNNSSTPVKPAPVDQTQADDLIAAVDGGGPTGGTPTLASLNRAFPIIDGFKPGGKVIDNMKRFVVLMSDGEPDGGSTEQANVISLVDQRAKFTDARNAITFSVGIGPFNKDANGNIVKGSGYDPVFMGKVGKVGGTHPAGTCSETATIPSQMCHFQVTPGTAGGTDQMKKDFLDAFNKIRAEASSCDFPVTIAPGVNLEEVNVNVTTDDGTVTTIVQDPTDGWSYDDPAAPTKITLNGNACSSASGALSGNVSIVFGCKTSR